MNKLLKTAVTIRSLKNLQKELAVSGDYDGALHIGMETDQHITDVACDYLGMDRIPGTVAGTLVREIAFEAVFADPDRRHELVKLLRQAASFESDNDLEKLRRAQSNLPELDAVVAALDDLPPVSPYSPGLPGESSLWVFGVGPYHTQVAVWADDLDSGLSAAVDWLKEEHPDEVWDDKELGEEAKIWFQDAEGRSPDSEEELFEFLMDGDAVSYTDSGWIDSDWTVDEIDEGSSLYQELVEY